MMLVVDTNILVDYLKGSEQAIRWLEDLGDEELALPGFVALEVLQGCRDKAEMHRISKELLERYAIVWPTTEDCNRAIRHYVRLMPESGIGVMDILIGETAAGLGVPIYTLNTKHFDPIPNVQAIRPY